jgi:hypothetical protein
MNGLSNSNPVQETFLLGARFSTKPSLAILLDSTISQEYYEICEALFSSSKYEYDTLIFSSDNSAPIFQAPCAIFYYNYLEQYNGSVLALTLRGAINAAESGCSLKNKIWHISDITEFQMAETVIPRLFEFFDSIYFVNDSVKSIFFEVFPKIQSDKILVSSIDELLAKKHTL